MCSFLMFQMYNGGDLLISVYSVWYLTPLYSKFRGGWFNQANTNDGWLDSSDVFRKDLKSNNAHQQEGKQSHYVLDNTGFPFVVEPWWIITCTKAVSCARSTTWCSWMRSGRLFSRWVTLNISALTTFTRMRNTCALFCVKVNARTTVKCLFFCLQEDGNFLLCNEDSGWSSGTNRTKGFHLCLENDCELVMYDSGDDAISRTDNKKANCSQGHLLLTDDGILKIIWDDKEIWTSK